MSKTDKGFIWRPDADHSQHRPIVVLRLLGMSPRAIADLTGKSTSLIRWTLKVYGSTFGDTYEVQPEAYEAMKLPSWIPHVSQPTAKLDLKKIATAMNLCDVDEDNSVRMKLPTD